MKTLKRTYALSADTVRRFEENVPVGQRSAVLSGLLALWIEDRQRARLRADLIEGCRDMWDVYAETAREWEATDDQLWSAADA